MQLAYNFESYWNLSNNPPDYITYHVTAIRFIIWRDFYKISLVIWTHEDQLKENLDT